LNLGFREVEMGIEKNLVEAIPRGRRRHGGGSGGVRRRRRKEVVLD
jgi:hypothetical protein